MCFRRGVSQSGDIDILITHPHLTGDKLEKKQKGKDLKNIVEKLEKCGLLTDTLSLGTTKYMVRNLSHKSSSVL